MNVRVIRNEYWQGNFLENEDYYLMGVEYYYLAVGFQNMRILLRAC